MSLPSSLMSVAKLCEQCGRPYHTFCIPCYRRQKAEAREELLNKYGLTEERIIAKLAEHVFERNNVVALKEAITLKDMRPATKIEATGPEGGPVEFEASKERLLEILKRLKKK